MEKLTLLRLKLSAIFGIPLGESTAKGGSTQIGPKFWVSSKGSKPIQPRLSIIQYNIQIRQMTHPLQLSQTKPNCPSHGRIDLGYSLFGANPYFLS